MQKELKDLKPTKEFMICFDSDGCVFDTMEIKHKECFCPNYIKHFDLQSVSKYAREAWDFVNLYSKTRGCNRFLALIKSIELLKSRSEVIDRKAVIHNLASLVEWTEKETKMGNPALIKYAEEVKDPIIDRTLKWSIEVNKDVKEMVHGIGPFPYVRDILENTDSRADMIVVSQTPMEALIREWEENDMKKYVKIIAGQEYGTKTEHIALAAKNKYPDSKILMVGDAPGDYKAAKSNGVLFFPVNPGKEEISWKRLFNEGLDRFFNGAFAGKYEEELIREFESYLPEEPTW